MVQGSQRTRFSGSALVRLLALGTEADIPPSKPAFAQRLSQWLGWTDAISLAAALNEPAAPKPAALARTAQAARTMEDEFARVRAALAATIADDFCARPGKAGAAPDVIDLAALRRRYAARLQATEARIVALRSRLRQALAASSPAMARLAAVDAVMEQVLSAQERAALASLPTWLEQRFERRRQAEPEAGPQALLQELQALLLAELDMRMQPAKGLLQALQAQAHKHTS
ncbi:MAG: DUF3348 family protein [Pseudomonadota bacterium]